VNDLHERQQTSEDVILIVQNKPWDPCKVEPLTEDQIRSALNQAAVINQAAERRSKEEAIVLPDVHECGGE